MTWIQTASGRRFDLASPTAAMVDFDTDVPDALARLARFTGHIAAGPYSVAQHSVLCCEAVMMETGDPLAAAYALLHDAHEAYIGDWSTPLKQAIRAVSARGTSDETDCDVETRHVAWTLDTLEAGVIAAVHEAAGLPPPHHVYRTIVKDIDYRMLHAERRQLLDPGRRPAQRWWYDGTKDAPRPIRSLGKLTAWPWVIGGDRFRVAFRHYVPLARQRLAQRGAA